MTDWVAIILLTGLVAWLIGLCWFAYLILKRGNY